MDGVKASIIGLSILFIGLTTLATHEKHQSLRQKKKQDKFNTSFSYNPDSCSKDAQGMVYFATGHTVFRVPYKDLLSIRGMSDTEKASLPARPKPNEPEGCPDNPAWGRGFSMKFRYRLKSENAEQEKESQIKFTLVDAQPGPYKGTSWLNQKSFERLKKYKSCTEAAPGIINCRKPDKKVTADFEFSAYKVRPDIYKSPSGKTIYIDCFIPEHGIYGRQCGVSYQLREGLGFFYDFYRAQLPINEFIEHDKALRKYIDDAQVQNYQWGQ